MKKRLISLLLVASFLLCSCSTNVTSGIDSDATQSSQTNAESNPQGDVTSLEDESSVETQSPEASTVVTDKPDETPTPETSTVVTDKSPETPAPETTTAATPTPESSTTVAPKPETSTTTTTTTTAKPKPVTTTTKKPAPQTTPAPVTTTKKPVAIPEGAQMSDLTPEQRYYVYGIDKEKREEYYEKISDIKLPIIHISTENKQHILSREDYIDCLVDVFNCDEEYELDAAYGEIKIRGNSTADYGNENTAKYGQVPYRIKFNKKTNMLGLNDGAKCKSWVLLKSQGNVIPDYTAFELAKVISGDEYYSSDCTFAYVYVNEKFKGLYLLCEQNQINKNRVDLPEHEEGYKGTDIGYFLELDNYFSDNPYWIRTDYCGETLTDIEGVTRKLVAAEYTIKNDIYSDEQVRFIEKYLTNIYKIMVQAIKYGKYYTFDENYNLVDASNLYDNAYDTINAVVDVKSVVNMYILYEICHDNDCGEGSFYMAVDFSGKSSFDRLTFTAPWDFNWAYTDEPTGKYYAAAFNSQEFVNRMGDRSNPWFILMMNADWFRDLVKIKWNEIYKSGGFTDFINGTRALVKEYKEDFTVNNGWTASPDSAYSLLDWVDKRIRWLNTQWKN